MRSWAPDAGILARIAGGDPEALGWLYRIHAGWLYALAKHVTGSRADAEDVVQEVFLGLPHATVTYRGRGSVEAWLRTLTIRAALRQKKLEQGWRGKARWLEDVAVESPDPLDVLNRIDMERAAAELPPHERAVLVLRYFQGLPYAEIATILGIAPGAARMRLCRAIRRLRRKLA